jgi:hypothetical protein
MEHAGGNGGGGPGGARSAELATRAASLHDLYKTLIATRTAEPALRRGDVTMLATHNDNRTLAFRRHVEGSTRDAVVAINNDTTGHDIVVPVAGVAADGTTFKDALTGARHVVQGGQLIVPDVAGNYGAVLLREP